MTECIDKYMLFTLHVLYNVLEWMCFHMCTDSIWYICNFWNLWSCSEILRSNLFTLKLWANCAAVSLGTPAHHVSTVSRHLTSFHRIFTDMCQQLFNDSFTYTWATTVQNVHRCNTLQGQYWNPRWTRWANKSRDWGGEFDLHSWNLNIW